MFKEDKTFAQILLITISMAGTSLFAEASVKPKTSNRLHLSVENVVDRIKDHNLDLLIKKEAVQRTLEQSYQRRAALLPQFSLRTQQSRQQLSRGFTSEEFDAPPFDSFGSRIEASLSVFDTQRYADFRLAKLNHEIETLQYEVAIQDILEQTLILYFTHLRDLRNAEISRQNLNRERALLELAEQQFEAGVTLKIDVKRAEVRVARQRRKVMEAEVDVHDTELQLKALLDINLDCRIQLDRSIIEELKAPSSIIKQGSKELLAELRPEFQSQQISLDQATLTKNAAKWQRLPSLEFFGDWGYDSNRFFDGKEGEAWMVGLRAQIPIWEGGRIASEKREASLALRQNEFRIRDLRNQIEREFKFALVAMDSLYSQIAIAGEEMRLGNEEVKLAKERYREGLGQNLELIDAHQRLSEAERSHLRAIYLYGLSRLAFARSIGSVERVLN